MQNFSKMELSENPLKALEIFINESLMPKSSSSSSFSSSKSINESVFTESASSFKDEEKYYSNFQVLLDSSELQLEDFLENINSDEQLHQQQQEQEDQQQHYEEYYDNSECYNEMEEYSPPPLSYPPPTFQHHHREQQQRFTENFNFNKISFDEFQQQQQRQRKRNEEIANILSPIQKLKHSNKQPSIKSNLKIHRKFSLLNGPCKQKKTQPKPMKFNNSMKEWQQKIIPIIQQISLKTETM